MKIKPYFRFKGRYKEKDRNIGRKRVVIEWQGGQNIRSKAIPKPELLLIILEQWERENKKTPKEYHKDYFKKNKKKLLKQQKEYNQKPEVKQRHKELSRRPKAKAYRKEYNQKPENQAKAKEYMENWRPDNKDKIKKHKNHGIWWQFSFQYLYAMCCRYSFQSYIFL